MLIEEPEQVAERLDRLPEPHVVGEDATEIVDREVGQEMEAIDLIGTQRRIEFGREIRCDFELDVARTVLDAFPGFRVEDLGSFGVG